MMKMYSLDSEVLKSYLDELQKPDFPCSLFEAGTAKSKYYELDSRLVMFWRLGLLDYATSRRLRSALSYVYTSARADYLDSLSDEEYELFCG